MQKRAVFGIVAVALTVVGISATTSVFRASVLALAGAFAIAQLLARELSGPLRTGIVAIFACVAGFGMMAPWIICSAPPYDGNVCPVAKDTRNRLQRARLKWALTLTLVAAGFAWWDVDHALQAGRTMLGKLLLALFFV